jgi:hypothetical protein
MAAGVARFFVVQHPKTGKNTPNDQKIPNGDETDQMAVKYTKYIKIFHSKTLRHVPNVPNFGLKICHLATLYNCGSGTFRLKWYRKTTMVSYCT